MRSITDVVKQVAATACVAALTMGVLGLAGCTMGQIKLSGAATGTGTGAVSGTTISGGVHGGRQPVIGATLQLYAAGAPAMPLSGSSTGGYGQGAAALIPAGSMSVGSANNYFPGGASGCSFVAGNPNNCTALPQTDATGSFVITGDYTCPAAESQVYLVATGGDPGTGSNNDALALMAGLGTCAASGTLSPSLFININEVTTVATVWALQQFLGAPTGVAANDYASQGGATAGVGVNIGAPSGPVGGYGASGVQTSVIGQKNAFSMINSLTDIGTGSSGTGSAGTAKNAWATPWAAKINTIANVLAACINAPDVNCAPLMSNATPTGAAHSAADTIQAAYYMARNPTNNVATLFGLTAGTPPYSGLSTAPNDWGVFVGLAPQFAAGGPAVASSYGGAIDEYGHAWLTNYNSQTAAPAFSAPFVSELGGDGHVLAGPFGNSAAASAGAAFATANGFTVSGGYTGGTGCSNSSVHTLTYTSNGPRSIAIDLSNTIWTNNPDDATTTCTSSASIHSLFRVSGGSGYATTDAGYTAPSIGTGLIENGSTYTGLAVDASNNVYIANSSTTSGKQQEFINGGASYVAGAALASSNPGITVVDTNTNNGGPFIWTTGYKNCPSQQGQIFQQPLSAFTTTSVVNTYQNSICTGSNGTTGTVTNISAVMQNPLGMAADANNNLWITNSATNNSVTFLAAGATGVVGTGADTSASSTSGFAGMVNPVSVAVDGNNNAWVASNGSSPYSVAVLSATLGNPITIGLAPQLLGSGNANTGFTFTSSSLPFPKTPKTIAVDPSGNVWFFNNNTTSIVNWVSVLVGQASPVITPLALQVKASKIGQLP